MLTIAALFQFKKELGGPVIQKLIVEPRSLLIFEEDAYQTHFHGIDEVDYDEVTSDLANVTQSFALGPEQETMDIEGKTVIYRGVRTSLTFRIVPKILV